MAEVQGILQQAAAVRPNERMMRIMAALNVLKASGDIMGDFAKWYYTSREEGRRTREEARSIEEFNERQTINAAEFYRKMHEDLAQKIKYDPWGGKGSYERQELEKQEAFNDLAMRKMVRQDIQEAQSIQDDTKYYESLEDLIQLGAANPNASPEELVALIQRREPLSSRNVARVLQDAKKDVVEKVQLLEAQKKKNEANIWKSPINAGGTIRDMLAMAQDDVTSGRDPGAVNEALLKIRSGLATGEFTKWEDKASPMELPVRLNNFFNSIGPEGLDVLRTAFVPGSTLYQAGITPATDGLVRGRIAEGSATVPDLMVASFFDNRGQLKPDYQPFATRQLARNLSRAQFQEGAYQTPEQRAEAAKAAIAKMPGVAPSAPPGWSVSEPFSLANKRGENLSVWRSPSGVAINAPPLNETERSAYALYRAAGIEPPLGQTKLPGEGGYYVGAGPLGGGQYIGRSTEQERIAKQTRGQQRSFEEWRSRLNMKDAIKAYERALYAGARPPTEEERQKKESENWIGGAGVGAGYR